MKQLKALELRKEELEKRRLYMEDEFWLMDVNDEIVEIKEQIEDLLSNKE